MKYTSRFGTGAFLGALALLGGCAISTPFQGPGYDRSTGVSSDRADGIVIVALTHAVLGKERRNFDRGVDRVVDSLAQQPGLIGYSLRRELFGNEAWTMTVWRDEASLEDFVRSSTHQQAIRDGAGELAGVNFSRFELPATELPIGWDTALEYLAASGRSYSRQATDQD